MAEPTQHRISQIIDVGTTGGDWMFKQEDMVFGPLPARQLIEKLYLGDVTGSTLVAPSAHDGDYVPLREVHGEEGHLAKAAARLRVKRDTDEYSTLQLRNTRARTAVVVGAIVGALAIAGGGAYYLVIERQRHLQQEIDEIPITGNAPEIASAAGASQAEEVEIPVPGAPPGSLHRVKRGPGSGAPGAAGHGGNDGLADINFDKGTIIGAELRQKPALIPCIKQELQRVPAFRGDIKFTVAIGNDGHVAKLWMDDSQFKDGPLETCFTQKMAAWKFATYEGERATLSDSFHVGQ